MAKLNDWQSSSAAELPPHRLRESYCEAHCHSEPLGAAAAHSVSTACTKHTTLPYLFKYSAQYAVNSSTKDTRHTELTVMVVYQISLTMKRSEPLIMDVP